MFYVMIADLRTNHFLLPAFTSYNHLNIPFAYPPLSFYIAGLISSIGISTFDVLRWLPPLISTLSIFAFYWMASLMLTSRSKASLATMAYALMPRLFSWYVMGGGLSRSFGLLFLLISVRLDLGFIHSTRAEIYSMDCIIWRRRDPQSSRDRASYCCGLRLDLVFQRTKLARFT